ncbi:MAG: AI-2E family transporter [Salinivirgaceae bacterium]|nr:AI-2E family transporter [Salinivirgaceae bacterium]
MNIARLLKCLVGVTIFVTLIWFFSPIVIYVMLASVIALVGRPMVTLLMKFKIWKIRISKGVAALITLLLIWFFVFAFLSLFIPLLITEITIISSIDPQLLLSHFSEPLNSIQAFYNQYINYANETFSVKELILDRIAETFNISKVVAILSGISAALGNIVIAVFSVTFISFFLLRDRTLLLRVILLLFPENREAEILHASNSINQLLRRYFVGVALQSTFIFALVFIGLTIVGIDLSHVMLISSFAAVINVIPYVGPLIGALFGVVVGVLVNLQVYDQGALLYLMLYIAIVFAIVQLIDNFIFQPYIFSTTVKAHPLEIFIVILMSGFIGGVLGMIVGVPIYTILRVVAKEFLSIPFYT